MAVSLILLAGCLQETEEVTPPDEQEIIRQDSGLAEAILQMTLLDGSGDNILDNASCLTVSYPVEVRLKNLKMTLESSEDIPLLKELYEQEITVRNQFHLTFPIEVIRADHQRFSVNNQRELDLLAAQCEEGGGDEDIECLDFTYPVHLSTYDQLNQVADVKTFSSDESLYHFFSDIPENVLIALEYPVQLIAYDDELTINNNMDLEEAINDVQDACDEGDVPYHTAGPLFSTGHLRFMMTDAPFPSDLIREVQVTVTKLEIEGEIEVEGKPFITLFEGELTMDLLELTNGITAMLAEADLPEAYYDHLRLYIDESKVILEDGQVFELKVPGGPQAGIKINPEPSLNVQKGDTTEVLLDFDVSQSFIPQGNVNSPKGITGFILKPVIRAVVMHESGTISGTVTDAASSLPLADVQVTVLDQEDQTYTSTFTNEEGKYKILGLLPDAYTVTAERSGYVLSSAVQVEVSQLQKIDLHFSLEAE